MIKCFKFRKAILQTYSVYLKRNMKYLNVAEKNDAAKTIASLLSNGTARRREGYSVYNKIYEFEANVKQKNCKMVMTSVSGHLLQLEFVGAYRKWGNVDPYTLFSAPIQKMCPETSAQIKRTLEREIRQCQGLIIWTDCDREGENIGFEIVEVCRAVKPNISVYRAKFSEITSASVRRALNQLTEPNKLISDAVDVRIELDLRSGAALTRFQTMRFQRIFPTNIANKLISYGSCQLPTLGFVVDRYKEIEAFVSESFWKIRVLHTIDDLTVEFNWARNRLFDKAACEDFLLVCLTSPTAKVEEVTVKPKNKWRPTPMDTVQMEKLGSRKLKLSAKETLSIAEKLYTRGIISYPRTETNQFSKDIDLRSLVEKQTGHNLWGSFAQKVIEWGPNPRNGNKSDQAHPPIHPIKFVTDLQGNEARVYELICRHFLACVSKDAVGSETVVHIDIAGEKFTATGLCIYEQNYLEVYIYEKWNAKRIHKYEQGQVFEPTEIFMQEGATVAPPLLTEADLIALMEKHGIGTDATHAEHINTIKERGYIGVVENGYLVPGIIGMGICEGYDAMDIVLAKPLLRAQFENDLKELCEGKKNPSIVLNEHIQKYLEAYKQITEKITAMDGKIAHRINETPTLTSSENCNTHELEELFKCPKCDIASMSLRQGKNKNVFFIGCMNFPNCKNVVWIPEECKEPSVVNELCDKCGSNTKLLQIKFTNPYYKTLFSTPSGWYKTCLRCDQLFRDNFNINIDNVKRSGRIVADDSSSRSMQPNNSGSRMGTYNNNDKPGTSISKRNDIRLIKTRKKSNGIGEKPNLKKRSFSTLTNAATPNAITSENKEIEEAQINEEILNDFFENSYEITENLVCDNQVLNVNITNTANSNNDTTNDFDFASCFDDSASDFFRSDTNNFDDMAWGTSNNKRRLINNMPSVETSQSCNSNRPNRIPAEKEKPSTSQKMKLISCRQKRKYLTVQKDRANKGRKFYTCSNRSKSCNYFKWKDSDI